jgi:hypothetical protein
MTFSILLMMLFIPSLGHCGSFEETLRYFEQLGLDNKESAKPVAPVRSGPPVPRKPINLRMVSGREGEDNLDDPFSDQNRVAEKDSPEPVSRVNVASKVALIGSLLAESGLGQGMPHKPLAKNSEKATLATEDPRYSQLDQILTELGETELVFSEALTLFITQKVQGLTLPETYPQTGILQLSSKKALKQTTLILNRILAVSLAFQKEFNALLRDDAPSSHTMIQIENLLIRTLSSSELQASFSDYAVGLRALNQFMGKIEKKEKGKRTLSEFVEAFNQELASKGRQMYFLNIGSFLILPIQRALKYELFVKELIKAKGKFDSTDSLENLRRILQDFATQTNQKL